MVSCTSNCFLNVINLANSIIGVSILAMPYCFQKCGILLSMLLILVSGVLVRIACYLLLKSAVMARRRNFEYIAFHALGATGKLAVEIGIIGFLIGVCIAFFVVIGDLGPPLASQYMMIENTPNLRVQVLVFLGLFVALPLGLLKNVNSLTSLSAFSIAFYGWLVLKIFSEAVSKLSLNEWWHQVNWWKMDGLLPCLPIFSMALSCQTQLFEFFDTLLEPSIKRMMTVVNGAVYLCSAVYILVGVFGYIACYDQNITGNVLVNMTPSIITECIKVLFVITVVISFPLSLFPCRTSLHSLLFKQGLGHHEISANFIPDHRFRVLTITLVIVTISVAIMIPNIEFALGLIGSTIGTMICLIFPAVVFIHDTNKNCAEKRMAQVVLFTGVFMFFACTYSTLQQQPQEHQAPPVVVTDSISQSMMHYNLVLASSEPSVIKENINKDINVKDQLKENAEVKVEDKNVVNEKRQEPPIPREPEPKPPPKIEPKVDLDPQALQKEDKEIQKETLHQQPTPENNVDASLKEKQEQILRKLEEQQKEQKIIIEQQKKVLEELKLHRDIHEEAAKEKKLLEGAVDILKNADLDKSVKQDESPVKFKDKVKKEQSVEIISANKRKHEKESKPEVLIGKSNVSKVHVAALPQNDESNIASHAESAEKHKASLSEIQAKPKAYIMPKPQINDTPAESKHDAGVLDHKQPPQRSAYSEAIEDNKKALESKDKEQEKLSVNVRDSMQDESKLKVKLGEIPAATNKSEIHVQSKRSSELPVDNEKHEMR